MPNFIKICFAEPEPVTEPLSVHLGAYCDFIEGGEEKVDELWDEADVDQSGSLDKNECKQFCENLLEYIDDDRKQNYDADQIDDLYEEFDVDQNGYLDRGELSIFIKQVFSYKKATLKSNKDKSSSDEP